MWLSRSSILAHWQTGRFLARRASLWLMLFKNQVQFCITPLWAQNWQISGQKSIAVVNVVQKLCSILAHTPLACIDATFSNFPLAIWKWLITALPMHRWTQYYQTVGQKSVISTVMQGHTKIHCHWQGDDRIHDSYHHSWAIELNPYLLCDELAAL